MATDSYGMNIELPPDATKIHQFPGVVRVAMERVAEILAGDLPQGVVDAANAAAGTAVAAEIAGADLVRGDDERLPQPAPIYDVAFSIRDANGRASDLEFGTDGHVTERAMELWRKRMNVPRADPPASAAFSIRDMAGRASDIELGFDGHFTDRVVGLLKARINPTTTTVATYSAEITGTTPNRKLYRNDVATGQRTLVAGTNDPRNPVVTAAGVIVFEDSTGMRAQVPGKAAGPLTPTAAQYAMWGDSMTYSQLIYPARVASNLGVSAYNGGVGSQTSTEIAIRAGGIVPLVTLTAGSIPAGTTAAAATITPTGDYGASTATGAWTYAGTLAGIPGTLAFDRPTKTWSFTRTTAGTATAVAAGTPFLVTTPTYLDAVTVVWAGRNNLYSPFTGEYRLSQVIRDVRAIVDTRTPYNKRIIVMGQINGTNEGKAANGSVYRDTVRINAELAAEFGPMFYNIRRDFIDNGMSKAGLTPTTADTAAITDDAPPPSLMNTALDHPSDATGYPVIGDLVTQEIIKRGWTL